LCAFRSPASARRRKKWKKTPTKSSASCAHSGCRRCICLQNPEYSVALFQKIMRVEPAVADKLFKLYRDQYNPELTLPDSVIDALLAVGTFRLKEKPKAALSQQAVRDWSFAEKARK